MNNEIDKSSLTAKRFVAVPAESDLSVPGAIAGAVICKHEKIIWLWTHLQDSRSAVTGYEIQIDLDAMVKTLSGASQN